MSPNSDTETRAKPPGAGGPSSAPEPAPVQAAPRLRELLVLAGLAVAVVLASSIAVAMLLA
jgi:hypothetical protein